MCRVGRGEKDYLYQIVANKNNGIDVDKFDYFARDCYALGLTKSFDCMRLMKFARVLKVHHGDDSGSSNNTDSSMNGNTETAVNMTPTLAKRSTSYTSSPNYSTTTNDICYHIKEAWNLFELFHTRYALHKRAYQHRVSVAVELMINEAFILADPFITIPGMLIVIYIRYISDV